MGYLKSTPSKDGFFGDYGGAMLPPPLEPHFKDIREAYDRISKSADFIAELPGYLGGWPAGIYGFAANLLVFVVLALATKPEPTVDDLFSEIKTHEDRLTATT